MDPVRIGHVRYLNTWPLIEGLDRLEGVSLRPGAPSELLGMLSRGDADVALIPTADLARSPRPLTILRAGMIGSEGPTLTVRLLSSTPIEQIGVVHADTESHTSVALCRLLLSTRFGIKPEVVPFTVDGQSWPDAVLMIGDKVITSRPPADRYAHALDLGEAWHDWTGLAFVFAVWACRADRENDLPIATAEALLDRQRRHNATRLPRIAAQRAGEHAWTTDQALTYFTRHLRYDLNRSAIEGLETFVHRAAEAGILPACTVRWAGQVGTAS